MGKLGRAGRNDCKKLATTAMQDRLKKQGGCFFYENHYTNVLGQPRRVDAV